MEAPKDKKFYGSVTVSERGQMVIPAGARNDFKIKTGDKLLVFGDLEKGLGIVTADIMQRTMDGTVKFYSEMQPFIKNKEKK